MSLELWRHVLHVEPDIVFHTTRPAGHHLLRTVRRVGAVTGQDIPGDGGVTAGFR